VDDFFGVDRHAVVWNQSRKLGGRFLPLHFEAMAFAFHEECSATFGYLI
jgi:hypothetical protein